MLGIINVYLLWGAWKDLKVKTISDRYLLLGGTAGIIYGLIKIIMKEFFWEEQLMAYFPGLLILVIAKVTNEKIGYGDGWVVLILGSFLGIYEIYAVIQLAAILAAIVSVGLLCMKKAARDYKIPFLPFLWAAYICQWGIRYV